MARFNLTSPQFQFNHKKGNDHLTNRFSSHFIHNKKSIYLGLNSMVIISILAAQLISFTPLTAAAPLEQAQSPAPTTTATEATTTLASAVASATVTVTPTSAITSTITTTPTITATTAITLAAATALPTPTPTPTAAIGLETATATPTLTSASGQNTPTQTAVTGQAAIQEPITITLHAAPGFITPGGILNVFWDIANATTGMSPLDIQFTASLNLGPRESSQGTYNTDTRVLTVADAGSQGVTQWSAQPDSEAPVAITATLLLDGQVLDTDRLSLENKVYLPVGDHGGTLTAFGGRVRVTFPDGAADEPLEASIHNPKPGEMPPYSLSGSPFAIVARGVNSKTDIHQFNKPLTIEVACPSSPAVVVDPTASITPTVGAPISTTVVVTATAASSGGQSAPGGGCTPEQDGMSIFYYDVAQATWIPLDTQYDPQTGLLRA
ncbi:MAG: hypothetical protein P8Z00_19550, partial [Anaerolineales bacterium]